MEEIARARDSVEAFDDTLLDAGEGTPRPSGSPPDRGWEGSRFDHFDVLARIGQGGMGEVYLGHDRSLDRRVAIKVLPPELANEPQLQERFVREARAQARLQSPHVTHIHHIGRTPARDDRRASLYFAMEHVGGGSLDEVIERNERLDPERARRLMIEAAKGLRDASAAGIVHRDIKPGNLLLDKNGLLKLADFGVAKPLDGDTGMSHHGMVVGSPLYMPPEQAKGLTVDHRADMYSLGCTFFHLLVGEPPFDGDTSLAVVAKHMTEPAPSLRAKAPKIPPKLAAIVMRSLAKEPADRYPTYDALIEALEDAAPTAIQYAGFWARVAAVAIDALVAGVLIALVGWPGIVLFSMYLTACHMVWGRTVGKHLLNLRVQRTDGRPLELKRATARTLASLWMPVVVGLIILLTRGVAELTTLIERLQPSELDAVRSLVLAIVIGNALLSLLYFAGLAMAAFHPQKRAAHDLVAGTHVIYALRDRRPPATIPPPP
jgi:uncharacterized RDD family membrane protein YckC/tRNA A-37 threonylcarbamoyl transferase component Bud32